MRKKAGGTVAADVATRRGYPQFGAAEQEELALHTFLRTLTAERLRQHVRLTTPRSLNGALLEAERTENILVEQPCVDVSGPTISLGAETAPPARQAQDDSPKSPLPSSYSPAGKSCRLPIHALFLWHHLVWFCGVYFTVGELLISCGTKLLPAVSAAQYVGSQTGGGSQSVHQQLITGAGLQITRREKHMITSRGQQSHHHKKLQK
ncbi:uncharacterized protein LOC135248629 [Anguilla rostrata]|uniref:uncharacterized protein LOC135248629 n=1 Tax=Anguilla rostrata TaxID=7938 RepID=UPI0030D3486A